MEINRCSIITRRRWQIRGGEWYAFTWFFRRTILHGLLFLDLFGKDRKRTKDEIPLFLTKIVGDILQKSCSPGATKISIKLLARLNEITSGIHLVCTFNLPKDTSTWRAEGCHQA